MIEGTHRVGTADAMEELGREVGHSVEPPELLLLSGDLGAGKTLFVRGLAAGLGADPDDVSSPTFSLVNRYDGGRSRLYHLDLYRLRGAKDALDLGLEEILDERAIVAIEWPDRLGGLELPAALVVAISHADGDARVVTIRRSSWRTPGAR